MINKQGRVRILLVNTWNLFLWQSLIIKAPSTQTGSELYMKSAQRLLTGLRLGAAVPPFHHRCRDGMCSGQHPQSRCLSHEADVVDQQFLSHLAHTGPGLQSYLLTFWLSCPSWSSCSPLSSVYWRGCAGRRSQTCPRPACWHPWLFWFAHQTAEHGPT